MCLFCGVTDDDESYAFFETLPCHSRSGTVTLADYNDAPVSAMSWQNATNGTQVHVTPDLSSAMRVPGGSNVLDVLRSLGDYQTFVLALQARTLTCCTWHTHAR